MVTAIVLAVIAGLVTAAVSACVMTWWQRRTLTASTKVDGDRPRTVADLVRERNEKTAAEAAAAPPPELPRRTPGASRRRIPTPEVSETAEPTAPTQITSPAGNTASTKVTVPTSDGERKPSTVTESASPPRRPAVRLRRMPPLPPPSPSDTEPPWVRAKRISPGVPWDRQPDDDESECESPRGRTDADARQTPGGGTSTSELIRKLRAARRAAAERGTATDSSGGSALALAQQSAVSVLTSDATDPQSAVTPDDRQVVRVRVRDKDGTDLPDVTLALFDDRGREVASGQSDASGRSTLRAPYAGGFVLVARAAGHQPAATVLTVSDSVIDAEVQLAPSASLRGVVRGTDRGLAHVVLWQQGEIIAEMATGADGVYRFDDLAAGTYELVITSEGNEPITVTVQLSGGTETVHDLDVRRSDDRGDSQ